MRGVVAFAGLVLGAALFSTAPVVAQVRCTMPNGVVIEQRLSDSCPQGAVRSETMSGAPAPVREPQRAPQQAVRLGDGGRAVQTVSADEYGEAWPLTVQSGELRCVLPDPARPGIQALVIVVEGRAYQLNGTASSWAGKMGWFDLGSIWRDNRAIAGTKIPISPLIQRAQSLCDAKVPAAAVTLKKADAPESIAAAEADGGFPLGYFVVIVGGITALVMAIRGSAGASGPAMYCTTCGHEGPGKTVTRGAMLIEIVLWLCFLVPGLIYSIWRHSSKYKACASCGRRALVPPSSPVAQAAKRRVAE